VTGDSNGSPFGLSYQLILNPDWSFLSLFLAVVAIGAPHSVLRRQRDSWEDMTKEQGERKLPELVGCIDIDLSFTPFTNTLPIRRLNIAAGEAREIEVAHIEPPAFRPRPVPQRYTCIEPMKRYLFESLDSDFSAELEVDEDGLVLDYPGLFRRLPS
jgi:hypothetical protein